MIGPVNLYDHANFWLKKRGVPYAYLFAILLIVLGPALKPGMVLYPSEVLFRMPFYSELPGARAEANPVQFDLVYGCVPNAYFAWQAAREGYMPVWNPQSLCGSPILGTAVLVSPFFPINLIGVFLPFEFGLFIRTLLRFWVAGIFAYELAVLYGLKRLSASFAATAYMLSGFMVVWQGYPHCNVATVFPGVVYALERFCRGNNLPLQLSWTAWLALANAVMFTGGQFQLSLLVCFLQVAYLVLRWWGTPQNGGRKLISLWISLVLLGIAVSLGVAIAAPQILPFCEWFRLSSILQVRASAVKKWFRADFWKSLFALPVLVFPNLYGNPKWNMPYRPFLPWANNYLEWSMYVGVLCLAGAWASLVSWRRSSPVARLWSVVSIFWLLTIVELPPFDWLFQLPIIRLVTKGRERMIVCLGLSLLGGFGLQSVLSGDKRTRKEVLHAWSTTLLSVFVCGALMAIVLGTALPILKPKLIAYGERLAEKEYVGKDMVYHRNQVRKIADGIARAFTPTNPSMYAPVWVALAGWVILQGAKRARGPLPGWRGNALFVLSICDLVVWSFGFQSVTPRTRFYPPHTHCSLASAGWRFISNPSTRPGFHSGCASDV